MAWRLGPLLIGVLFACLPASPPQDGDPDGPGGWGASPLSWLERCGANDVDVSAYGVQEYDSDTRDAVKLDADVGTLIVVGDPSRRHLVVITLCPYGGDDSSPCSTRSLDGKTHVESFGEHDAIVLAPPSLDVELSTVVGELCVEKMRGDVRLNNARGGGTTVHADFADGARVSATTTRGRIRVTMLPEQASNIDAQIDEPAGITLNGLDLDGARDDTSFAGTIGSGSALGDLILRAYETGTILVEAR